MPHDHGRNLLGDVSFGCGPSCKLAESYGIFPFEFSTHTPVSNISSILQPLTTIACSPTISISCLATLVPCSWFLKLIAIHFLIGWCGKTILLLLDGVLKPSFVKMVEQNHLSLVRWCGRTILLSDGVAKPSFACQMVWQNHPFVRWCSKTILRLSDGVAKPSFSCQMVC